MPAIFTLSLPNAPAFFVFCFVSFSISPTRASSLHLPPYLCSHSVLLPHSSFAIPLSLSCSSIQHAAVLPPSASYEHCSFSPRFQCAHTDIRTCNLATSMGKRVIWNWQAKKKIVCHSNSLVCVCVMEWQCLIRISMTEQGNTIYKVKVTWYITAPHLFPSPFLSFFTNPLFLFPFLTLLLICSHRSVSSALCKNEVLWECAWENARDLVGNGGVGVGKER